ncbi:MAG: radical SAM protein [Candidatus Thermoplasmatota archaeon]|nr:radical SAM protein [Candidatus Thermoplasmatota archaeon]
MKTVKHWFEESVFTKPLSPACKMCAEGAKLVVLATGLCPASCFYCPLSFKKSGKDRIFADEWELENEKDTDKLIKEAVYIDAKGAGITGGDPLVVWERTAKFIKLLKEEFGTSFHIHLYTSGIKNGDHVNDLVSAGLDEIRFHPPPILWDKMEKNPITAYIKDAVKTGIDVAIEIPSIPNMENQIIKLIHWADGNDLKWINLNELEFSEKNAENLIKRKFDVKDEISAAVAGSQKTAYKVIEKIASENLKIGVHYCSSSFKDRIQLRNRILRRAGNIVKQHDIVTDEGMLLKGIVIHKKMSLSEVYSFIKDQFKIDVKYIFVDKEKNRIEVASWILEKIAKELNNKGFEVYLVEEYPTADRLEVERIPMPLDTSD